MSLPATGRLAVEPHETAGEGFVVRVDALSSPAGDIATSHLRGEPLAGRPLAEGFIGVSTQRAERWLARNAVDRLRIRYLFRVIRAGEGTEAEPIALDAQALQVYNASTGDVLLDTQRATARARPGAAALDERVLLWSPSTFREARWRRSGQPTLLFSTRTQSDGGQREIVLLVRESLADRELARYRAPGHDASLAMLPRGADEVIVVFTASRPGDTDPGSGSVEVWSADNTGRLVRRAAWSGSNDQQPPPWVRDPTAPLPTP